MSTISAALLSYGMSGRIFHAPFIEHHPGLNLAACWERSTKRIGQHYPEARSCDSLEDVLTDPTIDLVVVNTPTWTHYDFTKQALESGKHVVVEKAFAGNAREAEELRNLAAKMGCKLAVFQNRRWDSDFLAIRDVLQRGVIGDIVEANLGYLRYDPNLSPKSHKEVPSSGAGILKDLGPHVIDQALVLFGMPDAVFADIGITREKSEVDDYFDLLLRYADKRVHVKGGYFYRQPLPEFSLFGKNGCFIKSRSDVQESQLDKGMKPGDPDYGLEPEGKAGRLVTDTLDEPVVSPRGNYAAFYAGMHESITNDKREPVTADDGVRVMQIIDAAWQSHAEGRLVSL